MSLFDIAFPNATVRIHVHQAGQSDEPHTIAFAACLPICVSAGEHIVTAHQQEQNRAEQPHLHTFITSLPPNDDPELTYALSPPPPPTHTIYFHYSLPYSFAAQLSAKYNRPLRAMEVYAHCLALLASNKISGALQAIIAAQKDGLDFLRCNIGVNVFFCHVSPCYVFLR